MDRRDFLTLGGSALAAGALATRRAAAIEPQAAGALFAAPPIETVRIGYVGI